MALEDDRIVLDPEGVVNDHTELDGPLESIAPVRELLLARDNRAVLRSADTPVLSVATSDQEPVRDSALP